MTPLRTIPQNSRMARDIARMEAVLRAIRQVTQEAGDDALKQFSAHDASRGGGGVTFSELFLTGEGRYDWQEFYHYYGIEHRSDAGADSADLPGYEGPQWVKISTQNRLLWLELAPRMMHALAGQNIHVVRDTSWRWDRVNTRPNGRARYVPVYQAMISLQPPGSMEFVPQNVIAELTLGICAADNPLADVHLIDWVQDTLGCLPMLSMGWTSEGFRARFSNEADLDNAREKLVPNYAFTKERIGNGPKKDWLLSVDLRAPTNV